MDTDSLIEGRLYRSENRFSGEQLHHLDYGSDYDRLAAAEVSSPQTDSELSDPHRTSMVQFAEDSDGEGDDKETGFVRQNTPHPKDLKAKAKLFGKGKNIDGKIVHHDVQDGSKDTETGQFKPGRVPMASSDVEPPYRRTSPMPPLELINLPDGEAPMIDHVQPAATVAHIYSNDNGQSEFSTSPETERHVGFVDDHGREDDIEELDEDEDEEDEESGQSKLPKNKLHRRDTPHHLKGKRINTQMDKEKALALIANVLKKQEMPQQATSTQSDDEAEEDRLPTPPPPPPADEEEEEEEIEVMSRTKMKIYSLNKCLN